MKRLTKLLLLFMTVCCLTAASQKPNIGFRIETPDGSTTPVVGQRFQIVLSVSGEESIPDPELPSIPGLKQLGVSTFTNVSIVNGNSTVMHEYSYSLAATKAGDFTIPSLILSKNLPATPPFKFSVASSPSAQAGSGVTAPTNKQTPYVAVSMLNKERAYVGEQILYTVKLYYRTKVSDLSMQPAVMEGFQVQDLGDSESSVESYQGYNYRVVTLRKALYPTRPGRLHIAPTFFDFKIWRGRNRGGSDLLFDDFFKDPFSGFGSSEAVTAASQEHDLEVLALPENGKPANFSGLVGDLTVDVSTPTKTIARGASLTVTTELRGTAMLRGDLALDWQQNSTKSGEAFKHYEDKPVNSSELVGSDPRLMYAENKRVFKSAIVPLQEGDLALGPVRFSYFNPTTKSYKTAESPAVHLQVTPGEVNESLLPRSPDTSAQMTTTKVLGDDILPNHSGPAIDKGMALHFKSPWILGLFFLPYVLVSGAALLQRLRRRDAAAETHIRRSRAAKRAQKRLAANDNLHAVFSDFLKERLNLPSGVITSEELTQSLRQYAVEASVIAEGSQMLQELETWRLGLATNPQILAKRLTTVITNIDRATRKKTAANTQMFVLLAAILLIATLLPSASLWADDLTTLTTKAETAYNAGDFASAKSLYLDAIRSLAQRKQSNGHLFYNLGNCYFRLADYGQALLQYRRAQLFLPRDRDLQANLEIVTDKLKSAAVEDIGGSGLNRLLFWNHFFTLQEILWSFLIVQALFGLLWVSRRKLPPGITTPLVSTVGFLYLLMLASLIGQWSNATTARGLVIDSNVKVRSGKGDDFISVLQLEHGAEFQLIEKDGDWWKIAVEKRKGFAPAKQLAEIGAWKLLTGDSIESLFPMNSASSPIDRAATGPVQ